jgi:hypothetical protein
MADPTPDISATSPGTVPRFETPLVLILMLVYLAALAFRFESIPAALCNDAAQEVQSGYNALISGSLPVMWFDPSDNGVETLWVGIAGLFILILGHDTLPAVMSSWLAVMGVLVFLWLTARRHRTVLNPIIVVLTAMSMLWLFHYGRTAMRCISSATFLAASIWAMSHFLQKPSGWRGPMLAGTALALGIYAYTTSRVPPLVLIAFGVVHLLLHIIRDRSGLRTWFIQYLKLGVVAVVVSIPNILHAFREPQQFLSRGSYNIRGSLMQRFDYVLESLATPIRYDAEKYSQVASLQWLFDVAASTLPQVRLAPVSMGVGIAMLAGLFCVRGWRELRGVAWFAVACYVAGCVLIGFMGPSLSRISIGIPVVAIFAGVALTLLAARAGKHGTTLVAVALVVLTAFNFYRYFDRMESTLWNYGYGYTAEQVAKRARQSSIDGIRSLVIVAKDANTVSYYTYGHKKNVALIEYYFINFDGSQLNASEIGRDFDQVLIALDGEPDRPEEIHPNTAAAIEWFSERFGAVEQNEVGRYVVFGTDKPPGGRLNLPGLPGSRQPVLR